MKMPKARKLVYKTLDKVPWLRRSLQRTLWRHRARRAYQLRAAKVPSLLNEYEVRVSDKRGPQYVIFIVVDALRKNHLPMYGYERDTTPFLRSLAEKSAIFENAFSAGSWTFPSVASILTGLYPHNHGGFHAEKGLINMDKELPNKVRQDIVALPDLLGTLGFESYLSAAITPAAIATAGWFKRSSVFLGGTDFHLKQLLKELKRNKTEQMFIYFHVADLHWPINAPQEYRNTFGQIADIPKLDRWQFFKEGPPSGSDFERYRLNRYKLYDCALRFVDAQLARLFRYLEEAQIIDSSLLFITADHGEAFWDHADMEWQFFADPRGHHGTGHGHNLFQEVINVPLICMGPGITAGRYNHNVSLVDLVPTLLQICGIQHKLTFDGRNLFDILNGRAVISEGIAYGYEKKAIIKDNYKLIHSEGDGVTLLFDLAKDPKEQHDLAKINIEKLQELKAMLPKAEVKGEALEIDRDVEEQLRHLGYM